MGKFERTMWEYSLRCAQYLRREGRYAEARVFLGHCKFYR